MSSQAETAARPEQRPSDADIQANLVQAVRLYAERAAEREDGFAAFPTGAAITATDVMVTVSAMLKAVNLQVFELGMWQAWSGKQ
ncbi:MAG TPA: hypothetical protein VE224_12130 [Pseudolabrys sp.]|jgi:hypothetical protein|nr:hypothetical protein [Pseudolabrys sp.]